MTVLPHDRPGLVARPPATPAGAVACPRLALARGLLAVVLPPLAFLASVLLCLAALVLADASTLLRASLVLAATVPAVGSILVSRSLMGAPPLSLWAGLGVLPSVAGGWLLVTLL